MSEENVDESVIKLIQTVLTDRTIILDKIKYQSKTGTPQGGRCSPLIWRIGLNDLLKKLSSMRNIKITAYADDTSLIIYSNSESGFKMKLKSAIKILNE